MIGVIKEFLEIDRNTKNLISRVNHVLIMLVNLYGRERRSGSNLMVLVKGLPTYTWDFQFKFHAVFC